MPEIEELISAAAALEGVKADDVTGLDRTRAISRSRQAAIWLAFKMTTNSLPKLGKLFHRHHTTVLYSIRAYDRHLANDPRAKARTQELLDRLLETEVQGAASTCDSGESTTNEAKQGDTH